MKPEILITFEEVKQHIIQNCKWINYRGRNVEPIINATEAFVMDYIKYPYGFAETDNLNDAGEIISKLDHSFWGILIDDGRKVRGHINTAVKVESKRWKENNAWFYGRYIGRLAYLLNEEKRKYVK